MRNGLPLTGWLADSAMATSTASAVSVTTKSSATMSVISWLVEKEKKWFAYYGSFLSENEMCSVKFSCTKWDNGGNRATNNNKIFTFVGGEGFKSKFMIIFPEVRFTSLTSAADASASTGASATCQTTSHVWMKHLMFIKPGFCPEMNFMLYQVAFKCWILTWISIDWTGASWRTRNNY